MLFLREFYNGFSRSFRLYPCRGTFHQIVCICLVDLLRLGKPFCWHGIRNSQWKTTSFDHLLDSRRKLLDILRHSNSKRIQKGTSNSNILKRARLGDVEDLLQEWCPKKDQPDQIVFIGILIGKTRFLPDRAFWWPNCIIVTLDMPFCMNTSLHFVVNWRQKCNSYEMDVGSPELYLKNQFPKVTLIFEGG